CTLNPTPEPGRPTPPRPRFIAVTGSLDIGFRQFTYNASQGALANYMESEDGQTMFGMAVELWPAALVRASSFGGLSVFLKAELPLNHQDVLMYNVGSSYATNIQTDWSSYEAGVRYRSVFGPIAVDLGGGFVDD